MIEEELIRLRRHFHKYAEPAWMEFLTTAKIIDSTFIMEKKFILIKEWDFQKNQS